MHEWGPRLNADVIEREANLGLARNIVTGVTDLCDRYGRVIVLEDDLAISPDFIEFMLQALDRYENVEGVYQVSGFMFPTALASDADAIFLPLVTTWGWATWKRAWQAFEWQPKEIPEKLRNPAIRDTFDSFGDGRFVRMLEDRLSGRNDSWGILWKWAVFKRNGLVLFPRVSLVRQMGWDASGTHGASAPPYLQPPFDSFIRPRLPHPITFPSEIAIDIKAFQLIRSFMIAAGKKSLRGRLRAIAWAFRRMVTGTRRHNQLTQRQ